MIAKSTLLEDISAEKIAAGVRRVLRAAYSNEPCSGREIQKLLAVGRKGEVRWLVDLRAKRATDSVWKSWIPYSKKARIAWAALRWSLKLGIIRFMPGVFFIKVPSGRFGKWAEDAPELKEHAPVIFIGKPSSTEKLTVFLGDKRGRIAAVAKLALTEKAVDSIGNEANVLRQLQGVVPGIPRLISSRVRTGICVEEWVEGKSIGRRLTKKHLWLLFTLPRTGGKARLEDKFQLLIQSLTPEHRRIAEGSAVDAGCSGELPTVWEHGDFTPWNLKRTSAGDLILFDWEYASPNGLPLLDLLHFFYRQEYLFRDAGDVIRKFKENEFVREYCRVFQLSHKVQEELAVYYLLRSLLYQIPSLSPSETYESFVTRQLKKIR